MVFGEVKKRKAPGSFIRIKDQELGAFFMTDDWILWFLHVNLGLVFTE